MLKERNWSVYKLAQVSGMNPSTLGNLFARNNVPTIPTLEKICEALGISLSEFFAEGETVSPEARVDARMEQEWKTLSLSQKQLIISVIEQFQ